MFNDNGIIKYIEHELSTSVDEDSIAALKSILSKRIYELMLNDRNTLIAILYRVDVSESKLTQLLQEGDSEDAATAITGLMIERQLQKIKLRNTPQEK